ncbi:MAG: hypothetical protein LUG86_09395 [Oscillospiraceae bacterium]|nr:hypothetical protein [Oscillospiraceae bacterium]
MQESNKDWNVLFENLELGAQERIAAYALLAYLDTQDSEIRRRLMDCVVDVRVVELHPEGDGKWSKAKPMDSEINCPALTELLDGSLKYLCAYFEDGWRHSEEAAAEEIRTRTLELLHSISADILVRDMGTEMCEFVVRLSRWVRQ